MSGLDVVRRSLPLTEKKMDPPELGIVSARFYMIADLPTPGGPTNQRSRPREVPIKYGARGARVTSRWRITNEGIICRSWHCMSNEILQD